MKATTVSYMAGILDGEGWFNITRTLRKPSCGYSARIGVANTNRILIDWIVSNFGGKVSSRSPGNGQWGKKVRYEWYLTSVKAVEVCNQVLPYLVIKQDRARILIELNDLLSTSYRHVGVPKDIQDKKDSLYLQLRAITGTKHKVIFSS